MAGSRFVTNALGTFGYHYDGVSSRLSSIDIPNGQQTTFGYYDNSGDRALSNITHLTSTGAIVSRFDYGYSAPRRIGDWTQKQGNLPAVKYSLSYDQVDQLKDAMVRDVDTQALVNHYAYHYDPAGNRTSDQIDNLVATEVPNQLNQTSAPLMKALGRGLHSIQDQFAHGDWDNDHHPWKYHGDWMDNWQGRPDIHGPVERATKAYLEFFLIWLGLEQFCRTESTMSALHKKCAALGLFMAAILALPTLFESPWHNTFWAIAITVANFPGILLIGRFFPPEGYPGQSPLHCALMIFVQSIWWYLTLYLIARLTRRRALKNTQ